MSRQKPSSARNGSAAPVLRPAASSSSVSGSVSTSENGALGNNGKFVDNAAKSGRRLAAYAGKRTAANLLYRHDEKWSRRVSACGYVAHSPSVELQRKDHGEGQVSGSLSGLVSCKSVWACPVCSARISGVRRDELNELLSWSREQGHAVLMLTLTARHKAATALSPFLADLKEAARRLRQSRGWRELALVGSVTATEVTHGRNGWHPHLHLLLVLDKAASDALAAVEGVRAEWLRSLGKVGRDGNAAAFQVQQASAAGEYVAKFGAAEEIAVGRAKSGRAGSSSPWQLLADASAGDKRACALWVEFAVAFKGRSQLQWSRGLKAKVGLDDLDDDAAADVVPVTLRAWSGKSDAWRSARLRRCSLVDAAERGGDLDAAEFGQTDAARWRDDLSASDVLDDGSAPRDVPPSPVRGRRASVRSVEDVRAERQAVALSSARPSRSVKNTQDVSALHLQRMCNAPTS